MKQKPPWQTLSAIPTVEAATDSSLFVYARG
jgi:hypothetical protein